MRKAKRLGAAAIALLALLPFGLSSREKPNTKGNFILSTTSPISGEVSVTAPKADYSAAENDNNIDTYVILNNENTTINGGGASFENSVLTISGGGTYSIKGTLNGQIEIDCENKNSAVTLCLENASISCDNGPAINVISAGRGAHITLESGTKNSLSGSGNASFNSVDPFVLKSNCDLYIDGNGALNITADEKGGVRCESELHILGGEISIESFLDSLSAKNSLELKNCSLNIISNANGILTDGSDAGKGSLVFSGGTYRIESALDCIRSSQNLTITGGSFDLTSGGGSRGKQEKKNHSSVISDFQPSLAETIEAKNSEAVSAAHTITISDGEFAVNSLDDAFVAEDKISLSGGSYTIKSDRSAFSSNRSLSISGSSINATCYKDGVCARLVSVSDGSVYINAAKRSFSPGTHITQSGGTVVAFGSGKNSIKSTYVVTGGTAFLSGGTPVKRTAFKNNLCLSLKANLSSKTLFAITDEKGKPLFCLRLPKDCSGIWFSSPELTKRKSYNVYTGGMNTGVQKNGVYYGSSYTPGTLVKTVKAR